MIPYEMTVSMWTWTTRDDGSVTRPVATATAVPALVRTSSRAPMMELNNKTALLNNDASQEVKRLCSIELKGRKLQDRHAPLCARLYTRPPRCADLEVSKPYLSIPPVQIAPDLQTRARRSNLEYVSVTGAVRPPGSKFRRTADGAAVKDIRWGRARRDIESPTGISPDFRRSLLHI